MEFIIGFLGAVMCLLLFIAGAFLGWQMKERDDARTQKVTAKKLTEEQERQLREEQEAWKSLHNYSVEDAYGMRPIPSTAEKE